MSGKKKKSGPSRARERAPEPYGEPHAPPPAYFLSLTVENVRCFGPKQTLDLSDDNGRPRQWTVLLGDNGTGKTTLLESLVAMEAAPFRRPNSDDTAPPLFWPFGMDDRSLMGRLSRGRRMTTTIAASACSGSRLCDASGDRGCQDIHEVRIHAKDEDFGRAYSGTLQSMSPALEGLICFAYGACRRTGVSMVSGSGSWERNTSLFYDYAELKNAEEWLLRADYSAAKPSDISERTAKFRDRVIEVLIQLLPDIRRIVFTEPTEERMLPGVIFQTPYGGVTFSALSLGYRTLIAWMVDFASRLFERYPDSPNPLAEPAVVLVDEIDLHLHPSWQRKIMSYLSKRFPNTQFIATAHSPLVVQAAEDANIAVLRREGDHVVIDNNPEAVRGWRVDQILTSDLFGLETSRPPRYEEALKRRERLLSKSRLTKKDREELAQLESEIEAWPVGETKEDREAMDIIRRAAARLKQGE